MIVSLNKVGHDFGIGHLFEDVTATIDKRDKIVLIGRNGSGKSTLLKIITGELKPSDGELYVASTLKIGYQMQKRVNNLNQTLSEYYMEDKESLPKESVEYYSYDRRVRSILTGLGFGKDTWERGLSTFSGGELTRIALGKLFLVDYDILLLDEPTNHLDLESVEWLTSFLKSYKGAVVLVTHDRYLIRSIGNRFWELNSQKLWDFRGNFERYSSEREHLLKSGVRTRENLIKERDRLLAVAKRYRNWGEDKFIKQAMSKERMADRLQEKLDNIELPEENINAPKIKLPEPDRTGYIVLETQKLSFSYDGKKIFDEADFVMQRREKVSILGVNGSGKTTLLRIITGELDDYKGKITWGHNVHWGYLSQMKDDLDQTSDVMGEIGNLIPLWPDFEIRKYAGRFGFTGEDVFKAVTSLSGGERTRLALAKLILKKPNILVMDEPTNNLDIWSIEELEEVLKEYRGAIILISHDREFVENIADKFYTISDKKLLKTRSLAEYLSMTVKDKTSTETSEGKQSFQERRKLSNRKKTILDRLESISLEEKKNETVIEKAHGEMSINSTNFQKLNDLQLQIETSEEKILELLEEKEFLEKELEDLETLLKN